MKENIIYKEKIVNNTIEKIVEVPRIVEVKVPVERIIEIEKIIEVENPIMHQRIVEKEVLVEIIVEKAVEKIVYQDIPIDQTLVKQLIDLNAQIKKISKHNTALRSEIESMLLVNNIRGENVLEIYTDLSKYKGGLKDKCQELEVKIISMQRTAEREREAKNREVLESTNYRAFNLKNFLYRLLDKNLTLRTNLKDPTYVYLKDDKSSQKS